MCALLNDDIADDLDDSNRSNPSHCLHFTSPFDICVKGEVRILKRSRDPFQILRAPVISLEQLKSSDFVHILIILNYYSIRLTST